MPLLQDFFDQLVFPQRSCCSQHVISADVDQCPVKEQRSGSLYRFRRTRRPLDKLAQGRPARIKALKPVGKLVGVAAGLEKKLDGFEVTRRRRAQPGPPKIVSILHAEQNRKGSRRVQDGRQVATTLGSLAFRSQWHAVANKRARDLRHPTLRRQGNCPKPLY